MKKKARRFFIVYVILVGIIAYLNINGKITFGHGLGDLFYLTFLVVISTVLSFLFLSEKFLGARFVVFVVMLLVLLFIILKLTLYRGPEYSWNGRLFLQ